MRIPDLEVSFVKDQREKLGLTGGKMMMESKIDLKDSKEVRKECERQDIVMKKEKRNRDAAEAVKRNVREKREDKKKKMETQVKEAILEDINENIRDPTYEDQTNPETDQTRVEMHHFAAEIRRYHGGERAGAALWNAAIKDLEEAGAIHADGENKDADISERYTVDRYKCRRELKKFGASAKEKQNDKLQRGGGLTCIGADGKRDRKTKIVEEVVIDGEEVTKYRSGTEEHVAYTSEPAGEYLTHSTLEAGTGKGCAEDFLEVVAETGSEETLLAILCDGCNTNTGWKSGMFVNVERKLGRQLLCCSCMLHANELYLRAVFIKCDGGLGTTGPESFAGPMGKRCKDDLHLEDVQKFLSIETMVEVISDDLKKDLSRDQKLLHSYCTAIAAGKLPSSLAKQVVGPVNHSRWLTLAIRILVLYTRTEEPDLALVRVVKLISQVYAPMWFTIRKQNNFIHGPKLLHQTMVLLLKQDQWVLDMAKPVIQRNAFFAEPGMIACAMLASSELEVRSKIVNLIRNNRKKKPRKLRMKVLQGIRKFCTPKLQWDAKHWSDMISWDLPYFYEPHIILSIPDTELDRVLDFPFTFPKLPLHSTSVERAVKLVTEASSKVNILVH